MNEEGYIEIIVKDDIHDEYKTIRVYKELLLDQPNRASSEVQRFVGNYLSEIVSKLNGESPKPIPFSSLSEEARQQYMRDRYE